MSLVERLFQALGYTDFQLCPSDRPDVIARFRDYHLGIEVTTLHSDEGERNKSSLLRAEEMKKTREDKDRPYFMWGTLNPLPAFRVRIEDKVRLATQYDCAKFDDLILLISGQLPMPGGVASTYVQSLSINLDMLNQTFHELLLKSPFGATYIHLLMDKVIFEWSPSTRWLHIESKNIKV